MAFRRLLPWRISSRNNDRDLGFSRKLLMPFVDTSSSSSMTSSLPSNSSCYRFSSSDSGVSQQKPQQTNRGALMELLGTSSRDYYEEYRRSKYGGKITHKALLVDAVGTLLVPSQPMAQIYREIGEKYGVKYSEDEILYRYRWAYEQPWGRSRLRRSI